MCSRYLPGELESVELLQLRCGHFFDEFRWNIIVKLFELLRWHVFGSGLESVHFMWGRYVSGKCGFIKLHFMFNRSVYKYNWGDGVHKLCVGDLPGKLRRDKLL